MHVGFYLMHEATRSKTKQVQKRIQETNATIINEFKEKEFWNNIGKLDSKQVNILQPLGLYSPVIKSHLHHIRFLQISI